MALKQIRVQVKAFNGQCDTVCSECSSVRGIVTREATANNSGILVGTIVPNAQAISIWTEGCNCFVNFEYDDEQLTPGTLLRPCDICLVCGCIVEFVERAQGGLSGSFSIMSNGVTAIINPGDLLHVVPDGLIVTNLAPGTPDVLTIGVSCEDVRNCIGTDILTNNNNNTFTHVGIDSTSVTIPFNYILGTPAPGLLTLTKPNGAVDTVDICAVVTAGCPAPTSPAIAVNNTSAISIGLSGALNHTLTPQLVLSTAPGNAAVINGGGNPGLYVAGGTSDALVDNGDNTFTHTAQDGTITTVDYAYILQAGPGTSIRLLRPDVSAIDVDLCPIIAACASLIQTPITPVDTVTVDLTTSGTNGHTLQAAVKISTDAGNALTSTGTGLFVPTGSISCAAVRACLSALDTQSVNFTLDSITGQLSADVIIDPIAGNPLVSGVAGLSVSCEAIQDCVGAGMTAPFGLKYTDASNRFEIALSSTLGNAAVLDGSGLYVPTAAVGGPTPTITDNGNRSFTYNNGVNPNVTFFQGIQTLDLSDPCIGVGVNNAVRSVALAGGLMTIRSAPEHTAVGTSYYQEFYAGSFPNGGTFDVTPHSPTRLFWANIPLVTGQSIVNPSACRSMLVLLTLDYGVAYSDYADGSGDSSDPEFEFYIVTNQTGANYGGRITNRVDPVPGAPAVYGSWNGQGSYSRTILLAPSATLTISSYVDVFMASQAPAGNQGEMHEVRQKITAFGVTV